MFRKGTLSSVVLSLISTLVLYYWFDTFLFKDEHIRCLYLVTPYFMLFALSFGAIHDIIFKDKIKYNVCLLCGCISMIVSLTCLFAINKNPSIILAIVSMISFVCFIIFLHISRKYEKKSYIKKQNKKL